MLEDIPNIWLSDGRHFIECYFTIDAINDFQQNYPIYKFSNLKNHILAITAWNLITEYEDSRTQLCSFQNISIKLINERFIPQINEKAPPKRINSICIFRETDI